jgi:CheY-like chemotaxis protein
VIPGRFLLTLDDPKPPKQQIPDMATGKIDFTSLGKLKVLLAEDNGVNQFLAKATLENWGATVDVATNGLEAVTLHEQGRYDLILMDIQMPQMDGLEATKRIRQSPNLLKSRIPIIALTANVRPDNHDLYLAAGMNGYLPKPYGEEQLFHTITQTLNRQLVFRPPAPLAATKGQPMALYDLAHIQALSRGNAASVQRTLQLFQQHLPRQLQELQQSLQAGDWVKVGETAHNLKTSIDLMLITSLHDDIRFIELQARHKTQLQQVPPVVAKVVRILEQVLGQLHAGEIRN